MPLKSMVGAVATTAGENDYVGVYPAQLVAAPGQTAGVGGAARTLPDRSGAALPVLVIGTANALRRSDLLDCRQVLGADGQTPYWVADVAVGNTSDGSDRPYATLYLDLTYQKLGAGQVTRTLALAWNGQRSEQGQTPRWAVSIAQSDLQFDSGGSFQSGGQTYTIDPNGTHTYTLAGNVSFAHTVPCLNSRGGKVNLTPSFTASKTGFLPYAASATLQSNQTPTGDKSASIYQ